ANLSLAKKDALTLTRTHVKQGSRHMGMNEVLNWIILALVVGLGVEIKRLKAEIGRLKDGLNQEKAV
ncbi:MAG: hypothetical protein OXI72_12620, partial [Gemmatimonadota bacterium]|nr:hypothetical protein [Gemmatimonadota bacterium]